MKSSIRDWLPKRRWFQFSLSTFFILVTLFAVWLGFISFHAHEQRAIVARIKELGGIVRYDYQMGANPQQSPSGWPWLRRLVGDEYFQDVASVNLDGTQVSDADLRLIGRLRHTKKLSLNRTDISDEGLASIHGMSQLIYLGLMKTKVTSEGIRLLPQPQNAWVLVLEDTSVGDEAVSNLSGCQFLNLQGTKVTSEGMKGLAESKTLIDLSISRTAVDDSAVPTLSSVNTLASLYVWETRISGEGLFKLKNALPKCNVDGEIADFTGGFNPASPGPEGNGWKQRVAQLVLLNKAQKLKLLVLADPLVKDGHLETLEGLDHLDTLDLRSASVTGEGVEKLQKALPKLKIHR
jgi:internalin A